MQQELVVAGYVSKSQRLHNPKSAIASMVITLIELRAGDHVLIMAKTTFGLFVLALMSMLQGAQYTLLIRGSEPGSKCIELGSRKRSVMAYISAFAGRWLYKNCTGIVAVGTEARDSLVEKTIGLVTSIDLIPDVFVQFSTKLAIAKYRAAPAP